MLLKNKIGAYQIFAVLYLCRLLTTIIFSPFFSDGNLDNNWLVTVLISSFFILLLSVPSMILYKNYPESDLSELSKSISPLLSDVISVLYSLVFIFIASLSLSRFDLFTTSVIFPEKDMSVLLPIAVLICGYAAFLGIEGIARANTVLLSIIITGVVIIFVAVTKKIDVFNFEPIFFYPVSQSISNAFSSAAKTGEILIFLYLYKKTSGSLKKPFVFFCLFFVISSLILFFYLVGVSGEFASSQLFPFYSLAIIADFPYIER